MSWRVAESLETLLGQINAAAPNRDKASDGSIGDTDHANRTSDHNPHCGPGVVTARDFDHDPEAGADMNEWAEALRKSRDPRIKYVIWNGRMFSSYATSTHAPFTWRPYSGPNLHTIHMHVSVNCGTGMDSTRKWAEPQGKDWFSMATKEQLREVVQEEVAKAEKRIKAHNAKQRKLLAVGKEQKGYDPDKINLKTLSQK